MAKQLIAILIRWVFLWGVGLILAALWLTSCASAPARRPAVVQQFEGELRLRVNCQPVILVKPSTVVCTAILDGALDEKGYCPGTAWDWGDGARRIRQSDCPPWDGVTMFRTFQERHVYRTYGEFHPSLTLFKGPFIAVVGEGKVSIIEAEEN